MIPVSEKTNEVRAVITDFLLRGTFQIAAQRGGTRAEGAGTAELKRRIRSGGG